MAERDLWPSYSLQSNEAQMWLPAKGCAHSALLQLLFGLSVTLILCDPMNHSTPGFPVHHQLPEHAQTLIHQAGDAIQPSRPVTPSPPAFNLSQHQGLFQ